VALRALVGSFLLHAGVAVGVVAGGGPGHARGTEATTEILIEDLAAEPVPTAETPAVEREMPPAPAINHTHPYPVPATHDARPHDPSIVHDHAAPGVEAKAEAAPVAVAAVAPTMPVFALPSGSGAAVPAGAGQADHAHGAEEATTYAANAVSGAAKLAAAATAAYPADARADDLEGDVALEIVVDRAGTVVDARITKRAGHGFDEAALVAIRKYRFSPASRDGHAVRVRMPWTVQFRLR
jgi:TonB family protein